MHQSLMRVSVRLEIEIVLLIIVLLAAILLLGSLNFAHGQASESLHVTVWLFDNPVEISCLEARVEKDVLFLIKVTRHEQMLREISNFFERLMFGPGVVNTLIGSFFGSKSIRRASLSIG